MSKIKKIGITGSNGFIGSFVADKLLEKNYDVIAFDRHYNYSMFEEYNSKGSVDFRLGDLKDREAVFEFVNNSDVVINLGGLLGTQELNQTAIEAVKVNTLGALNIFDALRVYKKRCVQVTVGNHFMKNPYSITKSATEKFALMYNKEFNTDIRVLRPMNGYGPRQKDKPVKKIFPNVVIPALLNKDIVMYGSGNQIIDLIYVEDIAEVIVRLITTNDVDNSIVYEIGSGQNTTLKEAIHKILSYLDSTSKVISVPMRPGEDLTSVVQITEEGWQNLKRYLNFTKEDLTPEEEAMKSTIEWYSKNLSKFINKN